MNKKLRQILGEGNIMFNNFELDGFLQSSLDDINFANTRTFYNLSNIPHDWKNTVLLGAYTYSLSALAEREK